MTGMVTAGQVAQALESQGFEVWEVYCEPYDERFTIMFGDYFVDVFSTEVGCAVQSITYGGLFFQTTFHTGVASAVADVHEAIKNLRDLANQREGKL